MKEHRNNIRLDQSKHSVVTKHIISSNRSFDWENVEILDYETNFRKRNISEMIYIKGQNNKEYNLIKDTELLHRSYFNILDDIREHNC